MKGNILNILLCLLLVFGLAVGASAATLDTAKLTVTQGENQTTVVVDASSDEVLKALDAQGKTAKLTVPTVIEAESQVYVLKDGTVSVAHQWAGNDIQFQVPGAGTYVIRPGTPPTLDQQLQSQSPTVSVFEDKVLDQNYTVAHGTTIEAGGKQIQSAGDPKTLTAAGSLTIRQLSGNVDLFLDKGDQASFSADGTVILKAGENPAVGYGSLRATSLIGGKPVTYTYFLVPGETLTVRDGRVSGYDTFEPAAADAKTPNYRVAYESQDYVHTKGSHSSITAHCNGLYDYYTTISLTLEKTGETRLLAEKSGGKDVYPVSGIQVREGSTVLTLKQTYLDILPAGKHTITFRYADGGTAQSVLHVREPAAAAVADDTNPKTGDRILLPGAVMALCLLTAALLLKKKGTV